jgi:polyisoprenoid-binding protein YceI
MYRFAFKRFIAVALLMAFAMTAYTPAPRFFKTTDGRINFRSDAPLELIKASSTDLVGVVDTARKGFSFKVPISSFQGFNSRTQREHFNENYMQTEQYPEASFKGKIIEDIDLNADGTYTVRAKGLLTIHGVEKERSIKRDIVVKNGNVNIKTNFTVLLSDHDIPIPKVVYQKLANEIKVEVVANLQPR